MEDIEREDLQFDGSIDIKNEEPIGTLCSEDIDIKEELQEDQGQTNKNDHSYKTGVIKETAYGCDNRLSGEAIPVLYENCNLSETASNHYAIKEETDSEDQDYSDHVYEEQFPTFSNFDTYNTVVEPQLLKHTLYECHLCQYKSTKKSLLMAHMRIHIPEKPRECNVRKKDKGQQANLVHHFEAGERCYRCKICQYKSYKKSALKQHTKTHMNDKFCECDVCDYKSTLKSSLDNHVRSQHTGEKPYECDKCQYKGASKLNLVRHMKNHLQNKTIKCDRCDYKTNYKAHLIQHLSMHTGEKPFECDLCKYKSASRSNLRNHRKTHLEDKLYECEVCDFKTRLKTTLDRHLRSQHTGEKLFECDKCQYKGVVKSYLLEHMKKHTGEKPFGCVKCEYKSASKSNLKQHMKTHLEKKLYDCEFCDYKTSFRREIHCHLLMHTTIKKPDKGVMYQYKGARKSNFSTHLQTDTGKKSYGCKIVSIQRCPEVELFKSENDNSCHLRFSLSDTK